MFDGLLKCPCQTCKNVSYQDPDTVNLHLYQYGFRPDYFMWTSHGESYIENITPVDAASVESNPYRNMVIDAFEYEYSHENIRGDDVEEEPHLEAKKFFDMLKAAEKPLYEGCNMCLLSVAARVTNINSEYNVPNKDVDNFTSLIKDICPNNNDMTESFYKTRKLLEGLELPHQKIDVCPEGCRLFWKENVNLEECLIRKASRYKPTRENGKRSPKKVLHYLPIAPRLQRLYTTKSTAEQMRWHANSHSPEGVMNHPCDGEAWKHFNTTF